MRGGDGLLYLVLLLFIIGYFIISFIGIILGVAVIVFVLWVTYRLIMELAEKRKNTQTTTNRFIPIDLLKDIEQLERRFCQLMNKYGVDVIAKDTFANIYSDYFHTDSAHRIKLIKAAVSLGILPDIVKNIRSSKLLNIIDKHSKSLINSGYDEKEVKVVLYAAATSQGLYISSDGEIMPVHSRLDKIFYFVLQKQWIFFMLPLVGVIAIFAVRYCFEIRTINLFTTYLLTILIYIASFVSAWLYFDRKRENPLIGGLFIGANVAGIILYFISPWVCEILMRYFGIDFENYYLKENSQTIFLIILYVIGIAGGLFLSGTETTRLSSTGSTEVNPKFLGGLLGGIAISLVLCFTSYHIVSWITEVKDSITSSILRNSRVDDIKALSFNNIPLGSDIHDCIYKIRSIDNNYSVSSELEIVPFSLLNKFSLEDESNLIDSIVFIQTQDWEKVIFCVSKGKIVSIVCEPKSMSPQMMLKIYTEKYGTPEHKHSHIREYYSDDSPYTWSYQNGQIGIEGLGYRDHYMSVSNPFVYYIDNSYIQDVKRYNNKYHHHQDSLKAEHEKALKIEEQKREQERIQAEKEQRIKENERTKRTIEQI